MTELYDRSKGEAARSTSTRPTHLVAAGASRPDALAVVASAKQLLVGPKVHQVHQPLAARRARKAVGVPQGAMVTGALSIDRRTLLGKHASATATVLPGEGKVGSDLGGGVNVTPR